MRLDQFWAGCVGQFWFWLGLLAAFAFGLVVGAAGEQEQAEERIRELEEEIAELQSEAQGGYELE